LFERARYAPVALCGQDRGYAGDVHGHVHEKRPRKATHVYEKKTRKEKYSFVCYLGYVVLQVVLVAAMRCPSAAAAQTLVPAMQARLDLTVAEVARRLLLPKLGAILRPILERMVPPAVLAGGVAKTGDGASGGGGGNSWAVQRGGSGTGGEEAWGWKVLVALRWSLAHHVEIRRRETRLKTVEGLLASYCHHQAERRRQVNQKRLADSAVMRHQAQARHLETQVATCKWIRLQHTATHCNTLQHIATHRNTPQHTATHRNTPQHTATHCHTPQHR